MLNTFTIEADWIGAKSIAKALFLLHGKKVDLPPSLQWSEGGRGKVCRLQCLQLSSRVVDQDYWKRRTRLCETAVTLAYKRRWLNKPVKSIVNRMNAIVAAAEKKRKEEDAKTKAVLL